MKNKILIPLVIVGALAAFFSFKYGGGEGQSSDEKRVVIMQTIMKTLKEAHYSPRPLDDTFSARVYNKVLGELDPGKLFFTQKDIDILNNYKFKLDDEISAGNLEFFDTLNAMYLKRLDNGEGYYKKYLSAPFTFNGDETYDLTGEKLAYCADDAAMENRWHDYLKYRVLAKYVDLKKDRDKPVDADKKDKSKKKLSPEKTADVPAADKDKKNKTDAELEADAREAIRKNQEYMFKRLRKQKDDDRFAMYMNAVTNNEDPHTDYFPPKEKEMFDEAMSGTFFGIGAQLRPDAGKIKIVSIITGSPSWKQGELKAGDEIQKVAQGEKEPVDVQGYDIDDVVQLIRGKKGTEVRLTVKKTDGSTRVIPIIRGEVMMDETFAKSAIIKSKDGPIGYIYLPEFYSDFQHINGRRSAQDVEKEVVKLKNAGVKGIVLDLRYNGGGSLSDVVDMAGLFVGNGPVVQVKSNDGPASTLRAQNKEPLYDGPLAVMVTQGSASASEIMAAALQDYKRAVIIGSTTYGKGTVQKVVPLDEFIDPMTRLRLQNSMAEGTRTGNAGDNSSIGSLKITVQKFYRVNGGSTQLKGVTPDIMLPDTYEDVDLGERHDIAALKWDEIAPATYTPTNATGNISELISLSKSRVAANPTFSLIDESAGRLKKMEEDNTVSLNEEKYRKEQDEVTAISKKLEEIQKKTTPFDFVNPKEDMSNINADSAAITKNNDWLKNLKKDIYISETVNVVNDMAKQHSKVTVGNHVAY